MHFVLGLGMTGKDHDSNLCRYEHIFKNDLFIMSPG